MRRKLTRTVPLAAAHLLALLVLGSPAAANGRFPAAGLVGVSPADPAHLVVRTTFGVLVTRDGGESWGWICEEAIGYGGVEDPMLAFTANGTLLAGIFKGLSVSMDGGCGWSFAGGGLIDRYVTDLSTDRAEPSKAVLVASNGTGPSMFLTQVWETGDNGASWTQAGVDLSIEFLGLTIDAAPSDPMRLYVSGRRGAPNYLGFIERSSNRGATWESLPVTGADDKHLPYLAAIDPSNPDLLYVRLDGDPTDSLLVSTNAGQSWTTIFESAGELLGFALSPDGGEILVGGKQDGIWRAPTASLVFEKVSDIAALCLTWTAAGVYACADEFQAGFTVGLSTNKGMTFAPVMHRTAVCPLTCDPGTSAGAVCPMRWPATQLTIGSTSCGGAADAGTGPTPPPTTDDGCGCRVAPGDEGRGHWATPAVAAAFVAAALRRRVIRLRAAAARSKSTSHSSRTS